MIDTGALICWIMALIGFIVFLFWIFTPTEQQDWTKPPKDGKYPKPTECAGHLWLRAVDDQLCLLRQRCQICGCEHTKHVVVGFEGEKKRWLSEPYDLSLEQKDTLPCDHTFEHTGNEQRIGGYTMVERRCKHCGSTHYLNADG